MENNNMLRNWFSRAFGTILVLTAIYAFYLAWSNPELIRDPSSNEWTTVLHEANNFSISYPERLYLTVGEEDGIKGDKDARLIVGTIGSSIPNVLIIKVSIKPKTDATLQDALEWRNQYFEALESNPAKSISLGYEEIFLTEDTLNGVPILRRRYAFRETGLMAEEVYIAREQDIILINMRVSKEYFDEYLDVFNRMIESFEPLK